MARTVRPGSVSNERELSSGLEDEFFLSALQVQREQALAEEQYEAKASFDGNCFRHVKSQIDIRDWDLRRSLAGYMKARQAEDRLHQEVADRGKLLQEDRFKGVHEIEHLMRSNEPCGTVPRQDEHGPLAADAPLTGYESSLLDIPEDDDGISEIFTDRYFTQLLNDPETQLPDPIDIGDEHRRSAFTPVLHVQERRVNIDLSQTHHSHGESLLRSAPLIARTAKPGSVSNERESSQGLEEEILMSALQVQREQILAETKSEIQKCEAKASFDEFFFAIWKSQIDIRDWDFRRTLEGYMEASQAKDRLRQEVVDRVRALQEDRLRGFREIESVKRNH